MVWMFHYPCIRWVFEKIEIYEYPRHTINNKHAHVAWYELTINFAKLGMGLYCKYSYSIGAVMQGPLRPVGGGTSTS